MSQGDFVLAGILGWPVAQSRSPIIHNYWIEQYGLNGRYVPLPARPERLGEALAGLRALGFRGCNVTMPHKLAVMPLLDRVDETARRIGAVNCIVVGEDGTTSGVNNDGIGYVYSLLEAAPDWKADAGPIVLLGAGGGARAVMVALIDRGAKEIRLINRTAERAARLAHELGPVIRPLAWERRNDAIADAALLINATNQGMTGQPPLALALDKLPRQTVVSDLIYVPPETPLLAAARARGNRTVNGLGMLLHQARPAFKAWFGVMPEITPDLRAAVQATFGT